MNPLWSKIVNDISTLDNYPYAGHSAIVGTIARPWQNTDDVLGRFSDKRRVAYREYVAAGVEQGQRPEFA